MDYLKQYKLLIRKGKRLQKQRKLDNFGYYEEHHIIEKCIMLIRKPQCKKNKKSKKNLMNQSWNLVLLTSREHFIAHRLLYKIFQKYYGDKHVYTDKSLRAVTGFIYRKAHKNADYKITARTYEILRKEFSSLDNPKKGKILTISVRFNEFSKANRVYLGWKPWGSNPNFDLNKKKESSKRIGDKLRGRNLSKETVSKMNSKYIIYFEDGRIEEFSGLKNYAKKINIPRQYLTLISKGQFKQPMPYKGITKIINLTMQIEKFNKNMNILNNCISTIILNGIN